MKKPKLYTLIIYSGLIAYSSLIITFLLGIWRQFRFHKTMGKITFLLASIHIGFVVWRKIKISGRYTIK